jgi:isopenicillin N synthase-like dioxygenase
MTGGAYRSTAHRVRNRSGQGRLSFPLFLDPGWDIEVRPLPGCSAQDQDGADRWDGESVHEWDGPYGDYLLSRVSRVFPDLFDEIV